MGGAAGKKNVDEGGAEVVHVATCASATGSQSVAAGAGSASQDLEEVRPEKPKAAKEAKRPRPATKSDRSKEERDGGSKEGSSPPDGHGESAGGDSHRPPAIPGGKLRSGPDQASSGAPEDGSGVDVEALEARAVAEVAPVASRTPQSSATPKGSAAVAAVPVGPAVEAELAGDRPAPSFKPEDLIPACRDGNLANVQAFIKEKSRGASGIADVEESLFDVYGDSVLHHAVRSGDVEVVKALLDLGKVPVDIPNARNETALLLASRSGDSALVAALLVGNADVDRKDAGGFTPFLAGMFASVSEEILEMLVQAKANVSAQEGRGVGGLHFAALRGDASLTSWLLQRKADVDGQTEHGTTALMLAAKRGHLDIVSHLLKANASTSFADEAGCTALMHALSAGATEVATCILKGSASVDVVDCAGRGALFHAVLGGSQEALKAVLSCGGRVNTLDEEGRSPLYQACLMGEEAFVTRLLEAKADPNLSGRGSQVIVPGGSSGDGGEDRDSDAAMVCLHEARTCLQVLATLAHNELIPMLMDNGADLNAAPGSLGWTPLHLCAAVGNDDGAALLISRGAVVVQEDAEGNSAEDLAEKAGHRNVLDRLRAAAEAQPAAPQVPMTPAQRRQQRPGVRLAALGSAPEQEQPEEEEVPLAHFREEWTERNPADTLLDRVLGPLIHDAWKSSEWRIRWEALTHLAAHFSEVSGSPADIMQAVRQIIVSAGADKMSKVFVASLAVLEEMLSDSRMDALSTEEFTGLLCGQEPGSPAEDSTENILVVLLDQSDTGGGSSQAASPQQAAADALCSCVLHGRVPLDEGAWPLMSRIERRLRGEAGQGKRDRDRKTTGTLGPKCLTANFKLLGRLLSAFGLQQSGLFRRAILLPLLLRGTASEHSKVRAAACDSLIQTISLSGGLEERVWSLLPAAARKAVHRLASEKQGVNLTSFSPCEEDSIAKSTLIQEDDRAGSFVCLSELTPKIWSHLTEGGQRSGSKDGMSAKDAVAMAAAAAAIHSSSQPGASSTGGVADDSAADALQRAFQHKNWKVRAQSIEALANELATSGDGVKLIEDSEGGGAGGGPLLSQYVLRGHRVSTLQSALGQLLVDTVTAVFIAGADLLRLVSSQMPLYIAPLFLEPLLPPLMARLLDTSSKVRGKAIEAILEVTALHNCALSEMVAQSVASGSAWSSAPPGGAGKDGSDSDKSTGPRLQLLLRLVQQGSLAGGKWTDETWRGLADYAVRAAEHRSSDVRKDAHILLDTMKECGGGAQEAASRACEQISLASRSTRPVTGAMRPVTGAVGPGGLGRLGTSSTRQGTAMGSTGFTLTLGSTGRLSTAMRSKTSTRGSGGFRPRTGSTFGRPGTSGVGLADDVEESDNSVHSTPRAIDEQTGLSPVLPGAGEEEDGVKFFNVSTACPGADEAPDLAEAEEVMRQALPLAEALEEVALDFVSPLVLLFGDGWTRCFYSRQWQCRVAALMHLSASMAQRVEQISGSEVAPTAVGELLDGTMRAVHEGLGDQNVRVYAEACAAVANAVPSFCGVVDDRLLVAHLAPLLRQLCARMADTKEIARAQTSQALLRLLRPPVGNIVSPLALAMLVLRHLVPVKETGDDDKENNVSTGKGVSGNAKVNLGPASGWYCRLSVLRDLAKEHHKSIVGNPGATHPGEWLRLKDGLLHNDATVRYESGRLFALVCKLHLKCLGDEAAQMPARAAWVAALPKEVKGKTLVQVKRFLKLPEDEEVQAAPSAVPLASSVAGAASRAWQVPASLCSWAGCGPEALAVLSSPARGDEKAAISALRLLGKAACSHEKASGRSNIGADEAFAGICMALQQVLGSPVGADRSVFLCAVELCQAVVTRLAPSLSGLDINMGLGKVFPTLMERSSISGVIDVKVGVAGDKLVRELAKHPKVGCEAVTKMVITSISRSDMPMRSVVLLRTLLAEHGLRLCAQRDVVSLMLSAIGSHLEKAKAGKTNAANPVSQEAEALRPQLVQVLATCNQFSSDTVHFCMREVETEHRKLLMNALQEAPNPKLMALGATAAEQESVEVHLAGSAIRAASRGRGASPKPSSSEGEAGGGRTPKLSRSDLSASRCEPGAGAALGSRRPPRADDGSLGRRESQEPSSREPMSPGSRRTRNRRVIAAPTTGEGSDLGGRGGGFSEASTAASPGTSPRHQGMAGGSESSNLRAARPPRPSASGVAGPRHSSASGAQQEPSGSPPLERQRRSSRDNPSDARFGGTADARFLKSQEQEPVDSLGALASVLAKMEEAGKTR